MHVQNTQMTFVCFEWLQSVQLTRYSKPLILAAIVKIIFDKGPSFKRLER